jgi:hypothetical protein
MAIRQGQLSSAEERRAREGNADTRSQIFGVPELRTLWLAVVDRFTDGISGEIDRQRAAGIAPRGVDGRELTTALLWATERSLYVAGLDVGSALRSEEEAVRALFALWRGAIYGAGAPIASA